MRCCSFFYVSENNPLCIKGLDEYEFTKSIFEFKNKVIKKPSNVDVVLLGKNKSDENVILFLESKFSEYITGITKTEKKYEVGKSYFDKDKEACYSYPIYISSFADKLLRFDESNHKLYADSDKYIEGIKQMISHYYGVRNFLKKTTMKVIMIV